MSPNDIEYLVSWRSNKGFYTHDSVDVYRMRNFTWRVSDCEELVGEFQEMIMYSGNVLIFWFPVHLDESLDDRVREYRVGDKDAALIVTGLET